MLLQYLLEVIDKKALFTLQQHLIDDLPDGYQVKVTTYDSRHCIEVLDAEYDVKARLKPDSMVSKDAPFEKRLVLVWNPKEQWYTLSYQEVLNALTAVNWKPGLGA